MKNIFKISFIKTIIFNFVYFKFSQAIKFPVIISSNFRLKSLSGKVNIPENSSFGLIKLGFGDISIFDRKLSKGIWENNGIINFKGRTNIGHGSKISVGIEGKLTFGENFNITAESSIVCYNEVSFGHNCLLSWDILIMDTDFHKIYNQNNEMINPDKSVKIGHNVWVCNKVQILKGVLIADGCIVGSNTVVSKSLPIKNAIYSGNINSPIKENISWKI
ncbi:MULTISPECIES: acyltransferase [Empedobacter]|uniref:Acyltransferase n=1 Tax=Empedobacter stercoris TaxID=1628248 RepID=A0ABX1WM87_9FLAO|nr:acyltransferase [Empedobacter stercoris]NOJ75640.1 acyltransferase [Empedobacter stercoris]